MIDSPLIKGAGGDAFGKGFVDRYLYPAAELAESKNKSLDGVWDEKRR